MTVASTRSAEARCSCGRPARSATGSTCDSRASSPGAVVTARSAARLREVQAGSSYLSSEDPRVHLGLGGQTTVPRLVVSFPWGAQVVLRNVRADRIVDVRVPERRGTTSPSRLGRARRRRPPWPATGTTSRVTALERGEAPDMVQARDLYLTSLATWRAYRAEHTLADRNTAISYANHRLLLWLASYNKNLGSTFGTIDDAFCERRSGRPAAVGNRIADARIAQSRNDGSNERLQLRRPHVHAAERTARPGEPGGVVHDPTFWQPLALAQVSPRGSARCPRRYRHSSARNGERREVRRAEACGSRRRRRSATRRRRRTPPRPRSRRSARPRTDRRPALRLSRPAERRAAVARPRHDARLDLVLNGALNDAAVAVYGAKRRYDAPRPIELIRNLAFIHELPLVSGLTASRTESSRFAAPGGGCAETAGPARVHASVTGLAIGVGRIRIRGERLAHPARPAAPRGYSDLGAHAGTELPMDVAAGGKLGAAVARLALRNSHG